MSSAPLSAPLVTFVDTRLLLEMPNNSPPSLPTLTDDIVGSHQLLADALQPLLDGKLTPFTYTVPPVRRQAGGWTKKSFQVTVARTSVAHLLLPAHDAALFPDKFRKELHSMSAQQIVAYQAWSGVEKAAYAMLYSKEEWEANVAECRRVYKTTNKATNKAKKQKVTSSADAELVAPSPLVECDFVITTTAASEMIAPLKLTNNASYETETKVGIRSHPQIPSRLYDACKTLTVSVLCLCVCVCVLWSDRLYHELAPWTKLLLQIGCSTHSCSHSALTID